MCRGCSLPALPLGSRAAMRRQLGVQAPRRGPDRSWVPRPTVVRNTSRVASVSARATSGGRCAFSTKRRLEDGTDPETASMAGEPPSGLLDRMPPEVWT